MEIRLGYMHFDGESQNINFLEYLTQDEYITIQSACTILNKVAFNRGLFKMFSKNISDFFDYLPELLKLCISNNHELRTKRLHLNCNRLYINMLSSFRAYLDHSETYLKKTYGKESSEFLRFKKITNDIYDSFFSYRFIYRLRNYAQHCGFPINHISYSSHTPESVNEKGFSLNVSFNTDDLTKNYDSWGSIKNDFFAHGPQIDVLEITKDLYLQMLKIFQHLEIIDSPNVDMAITTIKNYIDRIPIKDALACVFVDVQHNELQTGLTFSVIDLSLLLFAHLNEV